MRTFLFLFLISIYANIFGQSISLDYLNQKQEINLVGGDMERSQSFLQKAANSQQVSDWCFKDIPFNVCRVSYDKKQEMVEGLKNFAFYADAIKSMKMVQQSNPNILFYSTMKSDYNGYDDENNLPDWICNYKPTTFFHVDKYAVFLADYLELMHQNGVPIYYLAVSKEWTQVINASRTVAIIKALKLILTSRKVPHPMFVDPGTWALNQGVSFINSIVRMKEQSLFHAFTSHEYNNSSSHYPAFVSAANNAGAFAWNPETGIGAGERTSGAEPVDIEAMLTAYSQKAFMYNAGIQGEVLFEMFSRGVSSETRSIYFNSGNTGYRMKSYFVMKLFANHILGRKFVPAEIANLPGVACMAFVDESEIALWIINNNTGDFNAVPLKLNNVNINGPVTQVGFDVDSPLRGLGQTLINAGGNRYNLNIKGKSIGFIKVQLQEPETTNNFILEKESLDFGYVSLSAPTEMRELIINAENMADNISITISGEAGTPFKIMNETSLAASPILWNHAIQIGFQPQQPGTYQATLNISSGSIEKKVILEGEAYEYQLVDLPFIEPFPHLTANAGPISNSIINSFSQYKGWEIKNGLSSSADRIHLSSNVGDVGFIRTPEISFDGPFELKFFARMLLNDSGATNAEKAANNGQRNIYAVMGNDTIYDHKKNGAGLYQNYNEWTCTFVYDGKQSIKFFPGVSAQGVWAGSIDGLTFGPKDASIKVQATNLPAVNIAYGQALHLGVLAKESVKSFFFPLKGYNLSQVISLALHDAANVFIPKTVYQPDASKQINEVVEVVVDGSSLTEGIYTTKILVSGENPYIRTRTLWLSYEITQTNNVENKVGAKSKIFTGNNFITIEPLAPACAEIYSITGALVKKTHIEKSESFQLAGGVYLVKIGIEVHKVVVK